MPNPTPPELVAQALARCFCAPSLPPCGEVCICMGCASDVLTALAAGYVVGQRDADIATHHSALLADAAAKVIRDRCKFCGTRFAVALDAHEAHCRRPPCPRAVGGGGA